MILRGGCLAGLAFLLSVQPAMADNPRKVAIGSGSPKGALLFKVPQSAIGHQLLFTRDGDGRSPPRAYWVGIEARPASEGERFIVTTLPAGRYRLEAVYQQGKWVACLQATTLTVSVEPGKIAYLGTLDTRATLASIQRNAGASNQGSARTFQWHFYRTNVAAPRVADRDTDGLARAASFVRQQMPRSSATATLADLQWGPYVTLKPSGRADRCN